MHVPFCATICTYCSFNRFIFQEDKARAYFRSLREEMQMVKDLGYDFSSIYVGGGTTAILPDKLYKTLELARKLFSIKEVSCEGDPNSLHKDLLYSLRGLVDRLSIGVQTFDDNILKKVSRYDKFGSGNEIIKRLENTIGILPTLNVDLIFNFPNQTEKTLDYDLQTIKNLKPNQVSIYPLMSSPSVKSAIKSSMGLVSLDNEARLYEQILDTMKDDFTQLSSWAFHIKKKRFLTNM